MEWLFYCLPVKVCTIPAVLLIVAYRVNIRVLPQLINKAFNDMHYYVIRFWLIWGPGHWGKFIEA